MMGFSVLILFIMPKMMANLGKLRYLLPLTKGIFINVKSFLFYYLVVDQDALKELQDNQPQNPLAEMPDLSTALTNIFSGGNNNERNNRRN